jgi:hypothetical protein
MTGHAIEVNRVLNLSLERLSFSDSLASSTGLSWRCQANTSFLRPKVNDHVAQLTVESLLLGAACSRQISVGEADPLPEQGRHPPVSHVIQQFLPASC